MSAYSLIGGLMIGSSVYHLLAYNGNVLGISGIYGSQVSKLLNSDRFFFDTKDIKTKASRRTNKVGTTKSEPPIAAGILRDWKLAFIAGLLVGGAILRVYRSDIEGRIGIPIFDDAFLREIHPLQTFLVGALVGAGTNIGGGCTSGHMLCGVSRLSVRSIVATATFFGTAVATVLFFHRAQTRFAPSTATFDLAIILLAQIPLLIYRYIIPAVTPSRWYKSVSSFFIAVHFAFALSLAGMLQPSKIQNFLVLPFSPSFDPSLAFVAIGGLLPNLIAWTTRLRYASRPVWSESFDLPTKKDIDWRLIFGSVFFGVGWGWLGVCPGPGLVMQGAFVDQWRSVGLWVLGMSTGCAAAIVGADILHRS